MRAAVLQHWQSADRRVRGSSPHARTAVETRVLSYLQGARASILCYLAFKHETTRWHPQYQESVAAGTSTLETRPRRVHEPRRSRAMNKLEQAQEPTPGRSRAMTSLRPASTCNTVDFTTPARARARCYTNDPFMQMLARAYVAANRDGLLSPHRTPPTRLALEISRTSSDRHLQPTNIIPLS